MGSNTPPERYEVERGTMTGEGALWGAGEWRNPSMSELQAQLDEAAAAQETGLAQNDLAEFYAFLRSTDLPFSVPGLPHVCCKILHRLGGISPAVALAIENHMYVMSSLVTFPLEDDAEEARRQSLLRLFREQRLLVANTSSQVHAERLSTFGVTVRREAEGFRVNGSSAFVSLSTQSDIMLFQAPIEDEGPGLFIISLRDKAGLEIGPFLFPRTMLDSDTRRIHFHDVLLPPEALLLSGLTEQILRLHRYETIWHQLLTTSLYLGAAARALDEARLFLRSVRGKEDRPLAELDGMVIDVGRLVIRYRAAWSLVMQTANRLGELAKSPLDLASVEALVDHACATKHAGTVCAEEVVTAVRRIIGARSFAGVAAQPIERLSLETLFGPLGPEVNAGIERRLGRRALGETPVITERLDGAVQDVAEGQKPSLSELQTQLDETAKALEAGLERNDLSEFYALFRSTDLPFAAPGLPHVCCQILQRLGSISPAVALAIENHLFVISALATFPLQEKNEEARRQSLLRLVQEKRLLVANTSSRVHADKLVTLGVIAQREGEGFRINGATAYVSLSTQSDIMLFQAPLEGEGLALFTIWLRDTPGLEIGPFLFPRTMLDSDTRRVTFKDVILPSEALLLSGMTEQILRLNQFEVVWHQLLSTSLYLGAAAGALEQARLFLRSVRGKDDRPLAELDGMVIDMGRLVVRYRQAWAGIEETADRLGELAGRPLDHPAALEDLLDLASATKHAGTLCAEEVVTAVRRIIGARSFAGLTAQPIERLSLETLFAPLGPDVNAVIERRLGRRALGESPILAERL
jgi:alkylation response protein AidB-like acyl-CoA dehydrogenase